MELIFYWGGDNYDDSKPVFFLCVYIGGYGAVVEKFFEEKAA